MSGAWSLRGELVLSCSCAVFCPCTLSLGLAPPTEGYCQTWAGIRIDEGRHDDTDLAGVKVGLIIEIPGLMSRGNWTAQDQQPSRFLRELPEDLLDKWQLLFRQG